MFSNVSRVRGGLSLNRSKFSFVRPLQKQKAAQTENITAQVSGAQTTNVAATLVETNRILVEIQQQLALDFANRIAEKKQLLELSRRSVLKQKAVKKENFVERGKNLAKGVLAPFQKVIAPAKSLFDKLIDFVTIVGGGILLNTAWTWLSDKKNQEKLNKVFKFLTDNWKLIVGIGIGVKLFGIVRTIKTAFTILTGALKLLGKALKFLRGPRRPPGGPGGRPGGRPGGGPVGGPGGGCPPLNCITSKVGEIAKSVVEEMQCAPGVLIPLIPYIFGLPEFQRVLGEKVKEQGGPITAQGPGGFGNFTEKFRQATSFMDPLLNPIEKVASSPATMVLGGAPGLPQVGRIGLPLLARIPGFARFFGGASTAAPVAKAARPQINLGSSTSSPIAPQARGIGADFSISSGVPKVSRPVKTPARNPIKKTGSTTLKKSVVKANPVTTDGKTQFGPKWSWRDILWKNKITDSAKKINETITDPKQLLEIYAGNNSTYKSLADRAAARSILRKKHNLQLPEVMEGVNPLQLDDATLKLFKEMVGAGFSKGGTIFGQGSQSVDSVPAMLAPGEEVIRASAAMLFRPLLKDINDNAGRLWTALSNAIGLQSRNNRRQEEVNTKFEELTKTFNDELKKMAQEKTKKKLKDLLKGRPTVQAGGSRMPTTSPNSLKVSAKQKQSPSSIRTYNVKKRSSSNGQPTIINMPMPAISLAGNQSPEAPNTNVQESSSTPISIVSFDSENPYISEAFASYGIFI